MGNMRWDETMWSIKPEKCFGNNRWAYWTKLLNKSDGRPKVMTFRWFRKGNVYLSDTDRYDTSCTNIYKQDHKQDDSAQQLTKLKKNLFETAQLDLAIHIFGSCPSLYLYIKVIVLNYRELGLSKPYISLSSLQSNISIFTSGIRCIPSFPNNY